MIFNNGSFKRPPLVFLALLLTSLWVVGCARKARVEIENGTPPRFIVSGHGTVNYFDILGPDLDRGASNRQGDQRDSLPPLKVYWKLIPNGAGTTPSVEEIGTIVYGQVPRGFTQVYPEDGLPPPLVESDLYSVALVVNDADSVNRFFSIREGKVFAEGK